MPLKVAGNGLSSIIYMQVSINWASLPSDACMFLRSPFGGTQTYAFLQVFPPQAQHLVSVSDC